MSLSRRGFLGRIGAVAAAVYAVNAEIARPETLPVQASLSSVCSDAEGKQYRLIRAHKDLHPGDLVCVTDGVPIGVAVGHITARNYGWMQIRGPAVVQVD